MKNARREGERWLRQAENDLAFARLAVRESFYAQACFIAQQTGEKALKAIVYVKGEREVLGPSLQELLDRLTALRDSTLREAAGLLDQYYIPTRYPSGLPGGVPFEAFSRSQAEGAVEAAARFVAAAKADLNVES
jgi:HEPN domain-containing protein